MEALGAARPPPAGAHAIERALREACAAGRRALDSEAAARALAPRELACTLLVIAAWDDVVAVAHLGDGAAVARRSGSDALFVLSGPDRGEFANETWFLTSPGWQDRVRVIVEEGVDAFCAFTDGCEAASLVRGEPPRPFQPFCDPLFDFAREVEDAGEASEEVRRLLESEAMRRSSGDDKTLAVALRRPGAGALPSAAGDRDPGARPTAAAWRALLLDARRALVRCRESPAHWAHREHGSCAWCDRRARTGLDPFPAGQRWQRALTVRLADPGAAPEADRARWLVRHTRARVAGGRVTPAERRWLEKAGMTLGLGRARTAELIEEGCAAGPAGGWPWRAVRERLSAWIDRDMGGRALSLVRMRPPRRAVLLGAVCLLGSGGALAGVAATAVPAAGGAGPAAARPRSTCAVAELPRSAVIGNTRGAGAYLRAEPSLSSPKQALPEGTAVRATGRTRTADALSWSEVEIDPKRAGWVATRYLVDASRPPARGKPGTIP